VNSFRVDNMFIFLL